MQISRLAQVPQFHIHLLRFLVSESVETVYGRIWAAQELNSLCCLEQLQDFSCTF